jgi:hypothetical protein
MLTLIAQKALRIRSVDEDDCSGLDEELVRSGGRTTMDRRRARR